MVDRGEEEEVARLDEALVFGLDVWMHDELLHAVGQRPHVELFLQRAVLRAVERGHVSS